MRYCDLNAFIVRVLGALVKLCLTLSLLLQVDRMSDA